MYRKEKLFSFHISKEEKQAIDELKKNGINISCFLRRELRRFADQKILHSQGNENEFGRMTNDKT